MRGRRLGLRRFGVLRLRINSPAGDGTAALRALNHPSVRQRWKDACHWDNDRRIYSESHEALLD